MGDFPALICLSLAGLIALAGSTSAQSSAEADAAALDRASDAVDADYAEDFFRIAFSQPAVEAIIWWDLSEAGAWLDGGGLLRKDLSKKPVYDRIQKLLREEWRTRFTRNTDANGQVRTRAFRGEYEIVVAGNTQALRVEKTGIAQLTITLD